MTGKTLTLAAFLGAALLAPARAEKTLDSKLPERVPSKNKLFTPPAKLKPSADGAGGGDDAFLTAPLRLQVEAEFNGMKRTADFVVNNAIQANYVEGGDKAFPVDSKGGKGIEYKKWGFIVNTLPITDPNDPTRVDIQLQIEVSGPSEDGMDISTWQVQTELMVVEGKKTALSRGAGKASVTVTDSSAE